MAQRLEVFQSLWAMELRSPHLPERTPKECFAMIAVQKGQRVRAGRLFGAAEALRERIQADMMPYERMEYEAALSNFKSLIEPDELSAAWQSGRSYTMDQAIDEALRYAEYKTRVGD